MTRVKGGKTSLKSRRNLLAHTKGFRFGRKSKVAQAREALFHVAKYSFAHRRDKKNDRRRMWNLKLNASLRPLGLSYSRFIAGLKAKESRLDRKVLAQMAEKHPEMFARIVESVK